MKYNLLQTHNLQRLGILLLCFIFSNPIQAASSSKIPDDIKQSVRRRVNNGYTTGIIVGVVTPQGREYYGYGKTSLPDGAQPDENTVFEIGSATKVFTGLLLARMVEQGQVALNDPIEKYLPKGTRTPTRGGKSIKLIDLATHTSGLPRMPDNFKPADPKNPYKDYSVPQMLEFLSRVQLPRDIGATYEYSNYGMGLLGYLLAQKAGLTYEQLVRRQITDPLHMPNTAIALSPQMKSRLAVPYQGKTKLSNWDLPTLAGAGALRSTANDLLTFLTANLGAQKSKDPLQNAMNLACRPRCSAGSDAMKIGLAWHILTFPGRQVIWHNGGTGGYHSFIGFDKAAQTGIVVLTNSPQDIDDLGFHFFLNSLPLKDCPPQTQSAKDIDVPLSPGEKLPSGREVFDRSIEKMGGRQALAKIHSRRVKADVEISASGVTVKGTQVSCQARPNKAYVKTILLGLLTAEEGCTGNIVWEIEPESGPRILTGNEEADILQLYAFDLTDYKNLYPTVVCTGKTRIADQLCYKVVATPKQGSGPTTWYFDVSSGLPVRKDYSVEQDHLKINVQSRLSDYKPVDGILYPFRSQEKALDFTINTTIKSIEHNPTLPATQFDPPNSIKKLTPPPKP